MKCAPQIKQTIVVRTTDLLFIACLLCFVLNRKSPVDVLSLWQYGAFLIVYICMRNFSKLHYPLLGIAVFGGVMETVVAVMQKMYILDNENVYFNVTGTFGHPAELGGMLSVCFTVSIGLLAWHYNRKNRFWAFIEGGVSLIILCGLVLSDSRASWLAAIVGCLSVVFCRFIGFEKVRRCNSFRLCVTKGLAVLCGAVFLYAVYLYKKDSADGRLLIWHVTADMICEKPLFGHGAGGWQSGYMLSQAAYFERHPDAPARMLADDVSCPYNEYLYIMTEQGVAGLLLILLVLYILTTYRSDDRLSFICKSAILSLGIFALFSYPSAMFPLMLLCVALWGMMRTKEIGRIHVGRTVKAALFLSVLFVVGGVSLWSFKAYDDCRVAMRNLRYEQESELHQRARDFLDKHYCRFRFNPLFMNAYARYAALNLPDDKVEEILRATAELIPSCELYCDMGDCFERKSAVAEAEQCYRQAAYMIPTRMTPRYKLFQLYVNCMDTVAACREATTLLNFQEKKAGTRTLRMKAIAKEYIENCTRNDSLGKKIR